MRIRTWKWRNVCSVVLVLMALIAVSAHAQQIAEWEMNTITEAEARLLVTVSSAKLSALHDLRAGIADAERGDYLSACVHHAEAVAIGGTDPFKKYFDGVALVLDEEQIKECLEEVRVRAAAKVQ